MKKFLLGAVALAFIALIVVAVANRDTALGSIIESQEYDFAYVDSTSATNTAPLVLKSSRGSLGSIVIASSTYDGSITFYHAAAADATSTADVITTFTSDQGPGTWTFDVATPKGLKVWIPATFDGKYTITYR